MQRYRFGIEEEYFLVNRQSAAPRSELPQPYMAAAQRRLGERLTTEWLRNSTEAGDFTARGGEPKVPPARQALAHLG